MILQEKSSINTKEKDNGRHGKYREYSDCNDGHCILCMVIHERLERSGRMKTFKLIVKGVLLYVTTLVTLLYMMGIDSIYDNGYFFHGLILVLILIGVCYKTIDKEELEILTLNRYLNHLDDEFN